MRQWQLQEAKTHFSELVEGALEGDVQIVTCRGRQAVAVVPYEEYEWMQGSMKSAWDILSTAPRLDEDDLLLVR